MGPLRVFPDYNVLEIIFCGNFTTRSKKKKLKKLGFEIKNGITMN